MAFLEFKNIRIAGVSAGVPKNKIETKTSSEDYSDAEYIRLTGIKEKRQSDVLTASDLCYEAAVRLLDDLEWKREEVDAIFFVSQFPDYILPATAPILQERLGLTKECYAIDISLGCSGWVYGLSVAAGLLTNGSIKKGLLLAGDAKKIAHYTVDPLFGCAGTATALEYKENSESLFFHMGTDGSGYDAIIIPDGGARNRFTEKSLVPEIGEDGVMRHKLQARMKGMDVFAFAITTVPKSIKKLSKQNNIDLPTVDYLLLHQANKMINEQIAKKLNFSKERLPSSLMNYGNTSSASIPLTMVTEIGKQLSLGERSLIACGFGVGLSWGTVYFKTNNMVVSNLVEVE